MGIAKTELPDVQLGWKGKGIIASVFTMVIVAVFFVLQSAGGNANAELPKDISGTCSIEYIDSTVLPGTQDEPSSSDAIQATTQVDLGEQAPSYASEQATEGADVSGAGKNEQETAVTATEGAQSNATTGTSKAQVKNVYKVTMPDDKKMIVYGTANGYIPKDGEYDFSGTARSDKGYNISIYTSHEVASSDDVHAASIDAYNASTFDRTQPIDEFIWVPDENYPIDNIVTTSAKNNAVATHVEELAVTGTDSVESADDGTEKTFPMVLSATALDSKSKLHEGCAYQDDVNIEVAFAYKNLFSDVDFALRGSLVDQYNNDPIVDANGNPITFDIPFKTESSYVLTDDDIRAQEAIENFKGAAARIIDAYNAREAAGASAAGADAGTALATPEAQAAASVENAITYQGTVPTIAEISGVLDMAIEQGTSALPDAAPYLNEFYSYYNSLGDDAKAENPIPEFPDLVKYLSTLHNAQAIRYASGDVAFSISAPASSVYAKKVLVALALFDGDNEVAKLYDGANQDELCIIYPGITTEATVYGTHEAAATKNIVVVDTISYVGLAPGVTYHLETMLVEKTTQSPVIDGTTGKSVTQMTEFTPQSTSGVVNVIFEPFDATSLAGREGVVFEKLVRCVDVTSADPGAEIAENADNREAEGRLHSTQMGTAAVIHYDVNDKSQTISFSKDEWQPGEIEEGMPLSQTGEGLKPLILGGVVILAIIGIAVTRIRQRRG